MVTCKKRRNFWLDEVVKDRGSHLCLLLPHLTPVSENEAPWSGHHFTSWLEVNGAEGLLMVPLGLGWALILTVEGEII